MTRRELIEPLITTAENYHRDQAREHQDLANGISDAWRDYDYQALRAMGIISAETTDALLAEDAESVEG